MDVNFELADLCRKRFKQTPIQVLEPILLKFIDLCVDLSKKSHARSGLVQYKNAAQQVSIPSIELVLKHFIARAESRLAAAEKEAAEEIAKLGAAEAAQEKEEEDGEDELELPLQPASMMMDSLLPTQAAAGGAVGERDRIERRIVVPAQRFCWDAYDISLDIAKGNDRLEVIYQVSLSA
jgi:translation initiation factor 3 subunit A